jgi:hypothetical protein
MELFIKKKIGKDNITFVVSGKNLYEVQMEAQKLSFSDVHKCGICGSDNLTLNARLARNKYKYVEVKCWDCKGSLVFGCTQEDPDVYYLRKNSNKSYDWKEYKPNEE